MLTRMSQNIVGVSTSVVCILHLLRGSEYRWVRTAGFVGELRVVCAAPVIRVLACLDSSATSLFHAARTCSCDKLGRGSVNGFMNFFDEPVPIDFGNWRIFHDRGSRLFSIIVIDWQQPGTTAHACLFLIVFLKSRLRFN